MKKVLDSETRAKLEKKKPEECGYSFFQNRKCEFFPCHDTNDVDSFNCLFCYCPLYALGNECGGKYVYLQNGIKDCSNCMIPHRRGSINTIMKLYPKISAIVSIKRETEK